MTTTDQSRKVHCLHLHDHPGKRRWWVLSDGVNRLNGPDKGTRKALQARWIVRFGTPAGWVYYTELYRQSEAAMTLADLQEEADPGSIVRFP